MATSHDLRRIALSLEGTTEAPHFDRMAFRVARTFATLPRDGLTANVLLAPDEQESLCLMVPEAFAPVGNAWGARGWTVVTLAAVDEARLRRTLETAWRHALPRPRPARRGSPARRP